MNMGIGADNIQLVKTLFPTEYQTGSSKVTGGILESMAGTTACHATINEVQSKAIQYNAMQ